MTEYIIVLVLVVKSPCRHAWFKVVWNMMDDPRSFVSTFKMVGTLLRFRVASWVWAASSIPYLFASSATPRDCKVQPVGALFSQIVRYPSRHPSLTKSQSVTSKDDLQEATQALTFPIYSNFGPSFGKVVVKVMESLTVIGWRENDIHPWWSNAWLSSEVPWRCT